MRYFIKDGAVLGFHLDDQVVAPGAYGDGVTIVRIPGREQPAFNEETRAYEIPTLSPDTIASSIKDECSRRIVAKLSAPLQANLTAYAVSLNTIATLGGTLTDEQRADLTMLAAIFSWVGRPSGMQGASDTMIAAGALDWGLDSKWPEWNADWDEFIDRF